MNQLTAKELSAIKDSLSNEELLVKKFNAMAEQTTDCEVKESFKQIANQHQSHYNALFSQLR